jgi:hypothetical protein
MSVVNPATTRIIGHDDEADLVALFKRGATTPHASLLLQTLFIPNRLRADRDGRCLLRLVLQARGRLAVSNYLTVEVAWEGKWPKTAEDVPKCIVVREV